MSAASSDARAMETKMRLIHPESENGKKIVLVVGGGFAGLSAAKELESETGAEVILIDRKNHHLFQPLLYQVATAGLNPADIAVPIRSQFAPESNVEVHMGDVQSIDLAEQVVRLDRVELKFDYLVLACGARHSYFGHPEWEEFAPGLKTLEQATEIRRRILVAFEQAENELDEAKRNALMTFVVVGAGPTGVEMAGAIADLSQRVLDSDFKRINTRSARIILLEAGPRVLASFTESLSQTGKDDLSAMGVDVRTGTRVIDINGEGVSIEGGPFIPAKTVIWAAGVQASPLTFEQEVERDRAGRVKVNSDFSIPGHPEIFVVGDMAAFNLGDGRFLPGLAPVAKQAGRHAARMIKASLHGEARTAFKYHDKGQMATIGKKRAVAQAGGFTLSGFIAWLGWLFVHVLYLIGFKNRLAVLFQWSWSYIFEKRGARLITAKEWRLDRDSIATMGERVS